MVESRWGELMINDSKLLIQRFCTSYLVNLIRIIVGGTFLYAGVAKIMRPYDFLSGIYTLHLFTREQGVFVAMAIPPLEVATGVAMFTRHNYRGALLLSVILSAAFVWIHGWVIHAGVDAVCNCFGAQSIITPKTSNSTTMIVAVGQLIASVFSLIVTVSNRGAKGLIMEEHSRQQD